jgi:DNA-binding transcriptional LysR family regulator
MGRMKMDRRWLPLNALRAFEAVARHGSFTAAANALLISQSALSRHVMGIEKLIGAQLFERRPHALVLTEAGQSLLPAVTRSFDRLEHALDDIGHDSLPTRRTLRVHLPPSFATQLAVPILRDFRRDCPEVDIDIVSPYGLGPSANDVDVAVVYSKQATSDAVTDLLWTIQPSILCHPDLVRAHDGKSLAAFVAANELMHVRLADLPRYHSWSEFIRQARIPEVNVERGLVFDTAILAVQYARSGEGLALVDANLFADDIHEGRLVQPFDAKLDDGYGYYLITQPDDLGDAAIALFRSWLIRRFGAKAAPAASPVRLVHANG